MVEASDHGYLTHKTYTCHTVQNITDTLNVVTLYIDGCLDFHDILVYWNESTLYNFRTSNYVQQRKTYKRKAATVHLNCSTVPSNTLCARIAAAVWRKTRDVICDLQSAMCAMSGMQYPGLRHIHVKFFTYFWMSIESFDKLLVLVGPRITYENTRLRLSVPPQERRSKRVFRKVFHFATRVSSLAVW
jgi:hypothetical protein